MYKNYCNDNGLLKQREPDGTAEIFGSKDHPNIRGTVRFYQTEHGVLVYANVCGLPTATSGSSEQVFGFHIHDGDSCTGDDQDPFADAGSHYDINHHMHPNHNGDLPPLLGNEGLALSIFLTNRFSVKDVIGRTVIIHGSPDDFTAQPSGNAGKKIGCGVIKV